jgi:hypothetical protein
VLKRVQLSGQTHTSSHRLQVGGINRKARQFLVWV